MSKRDFVVVGSSGGGGTIAWLLAKAGYRVTVLELGTDWAQPLDDEHVRYNCTSHDEYRYRVERPERKRRPRGDYNTMRPNDRVAAEPFSAGWTASMLGGGSVIWGAWSFRPLPVDLRLATFFERTNQLADLRTAGYAVADWPVTYQEMQPFFNVAETLLAVCGDRAAINASVEKSAWYKHVRSVLPEDNDDAWLPTFPFPSKPYPETPVGLAIRRGLENSGATVAPLPSAMVAPGTDGFRTREALREALQHWGGKKPAFWDAKADAIWSNQVRDACTLCGYCGEYLCWGKNGPKSGARSTTIPEMRNLPNVEIIQNARAYEVVYDARTRRASGVRYLDTTNPDRPQARFVEGHFVIVSCGAVQSARLLLLSDIGNRYDQVGRNATFHLFGLGSSFVFPPSFQGTLHGELGHTGNTTTFEHYFLKNANGEWIKAGTMVSTAKKNPLENAASFVERNPAEPPAKLLASMETYARSMELRITGDDLPMPANRVDLDPKFVDEYGFPVARITRDFGVAEKKMFALAEKPMLAAFDLYKDLPGSVAKYSKTANLNLIGDHQMGTCRMGNDPTRSVVDRFCRVHGVPNLFVVDSSFMPTGLGLNPMVSVVANALRVGTWIVQEAKRGDDLQADCLPE